MKCLVCNYSGEFGNIFTNSGSSFLGMLPKPHSAIGSVEIFVCPDCGALHSTMRDHIKMESRKTQPRSWYDKPKIKPTCSRCAYLKGTGHYYKCHVNDGSCPALNKPKEK